MNDRNAQFQNRRPQKPHRPPQTVLQSTVRVGQSGGELLDFVISLGVAGELRVSCAIPDDGKDGAPVYIRHHTNGSGRPRPPKEGGRFRGNPKRPPTQDAQDDSDEDYSESTSASP